MSPAGDPPPLRYAPYAGSARPFSIGLAPLDPCRWLEPDAAREAELAEKARLIAERPDVVVRSTAETRLSEADMLARLAAHMAADHGIAMPARPNSDEPPLVTAARHVQDDLVLMRKASDGWRLAAACLCFPASWSLADKFAQPMDAIHANVPGWAGRMAERVARIFDNLAPDAPVWRLNWSIDDGRRLHRPDAKGGQKSWAGREAEIEDAAHVRVERQTLFKSPATGDILFMIRTYLDPLAAFARRPDGSALAAALCDQLRGLDDAQLDYKGLRHARDALLVRLARLASEDAL